MKFLSKSACAVMAFALTVQALTSCGMKNPSKDPTPAEPVVKKVSIIGDSISTYDGWIPAGCATHYPTADGVVTSVEQVYWHMLVYSMMHNASVEKNISAGGTLVGNYAGDNRADSFIERYISLGIGDPNLVIIHGGRNDVNHKEYTVLCPGSSESAASRTPVAVSKLVPVFTKADAAKTREEAYALPDGTFAEAYVKLLQMIKVDYPKAHVVCIIGDMVYEGVESVIAFAADHYGYKSVDFYSEYGFNSPKVVKQAGSHPGPEGFKYMAEKIYAEQSEYLENVPAPTGAPEPWVEPNPLDPVQCVAIWDYQTINLTAADLETWIDKPESYKIVGTNDKYLLAHKGAGKLFFYNATDKTSVGAPDPSTITSTAQYPRGKASAGNPYSAWVWTGDYYLMQITPGDVVEKGTRFEVSVTLKSAATSFKYWVVEYQDGQSWIPLGELKEAHGFNYMIALESNVITTFDYEFAVPAETEQLNFRVRCVAPWRTGNDTEQTAPLSGSFHLVKFKLK